MLSPRARMTPGCAWTLPRRTGSRSCPAAAAPAGWAAGGSRPSRRSSRGPPRSPRETNRRCRGRGGGPISCRYRLTRDELDLVAAIDLGEVHAHVVGGLRRDVLADEISADRELAMAPVHEHGEADGARTPVVHERVHGGPDGAAGEEHVVDEHDDPVVDREVERGFVHDRRIADAREVVAVERDVEGAQRHDRVLVLADRLTHADGEDVAARADADDGEGGKLAVALADLVSDAGDRATDVVGAEQDGRRRGQSRLPFPASQDRSLKVVRSGKSSRYFRVMVARKAREPLKTMESGYWPTASVAGMSSAILPFASSRPETRRGSFARSPSTMVSSPLAARPFADTTVKPVGRKPPRVAVVAPVYTTIVPSGSVVRGPAGRFTTGGSVGARVGTRTVRIHSFDSASKKYDWSAWTSGGNGGGGTSGPRSCTHAAVTGSQVYVVCSLVGSATQEIIEGGSYQLGVRKSWGRVHRCDVRSLRPDCSSSAPSHSRRPQHARRRSPVRGMGTRQRRRLIHSPQPTRVTPHASIPRHSSADSRSKTGPTAGASSCAGSCCRSTALAFPPTWTFCRTRHVRIAADGTRGSISQPTRARRCAPSPRARWCASTAATSSGMPRAKRSRSMRPCSSGTRPKRRSTAYAAGRSGSIMAAASCRVTRICRRSPVSRAGRASNAERSSCRWAAGDIRKAGRTRTWRFACAAGMSRMG